MKANFCKNLNLLFKRNLLTGEKTLIKIFQTKRQAQLYRRRFFAMQAFKQNVGLQDIAPIEIWDVTTSNDPLYLKLKLEED